MAEGLDLLGDRWTMLILRDLAWYGPARFKDLTDHNPGIPTALLTDRLETLEATGVIVHSGPFYGLIDEDGAIRGAIDAIAAVGMTRLADQPLNRERIEYLVRRRSTDHADLIAGLPQTEVTLDVDGFQFKLQIQDGRLVVGNPDPESRVLHLEKKEFLSIVSGDSAPDGIPEQVSTVLRPA